MPQVTPKSSQDYRVPYADTDQMGFVYYANFLVYFERIRNEIMKGGRLDEAREKFKYHSLQSKV